jgi:hypothetical protein
MTGSMTGSMTGRLRIVALAVVIAVAGRPASQAHGENFFKRKAKAAARAIGDAISPGVSSLAEAASTPVFRNAESTGRRLLYDFEGVTARRLDQAGTLVNKAVDNAFENTGKLAAQIDISLEARIMQLDKSVNGTIDNVGQEARATLVTVDQVIGHNIARARKAALDVLERVDQSVEDRLAQLDEMLRLRLGDVSQMIQTTLAQVDEIAKARLDQLDEIAGRRIGNLDVVATKQGLSLEAMLVRLATLLGAFFFFAFLMWSAWTNFVKHSELIDRLRNSDSGTGIEKLTIKRKLQLWTLQTVFALGCFAAVVAVAAYLPKPAEARRSAQVAEHARALGNAVRGYDFSSVRYHYSQLEILRPGDPSFKSLAMKADLLRDIFERPARLHTADGLRELERQLNQARELAPEDPDFRVLTGYVIWQAGTTREDELDAAYQCAQALTMPRRGMVIERFLGGSFMLRALAENYVRRFRHDPYQAAPNTEESEKLAQIARVQIPAEPTRMEELAQVLAYNELVAKLDDEMMPAYVEMLEAHAAYAAAATPKPSKGKPGPRTYDVEGATKWRAARSKAAADVVQAWLAFDKALADSDELAGDPAALNAFTLDDAIMSQAMYYWAEAHDDDGNEIPLRPNVVPAVGVLTFFDGAAPTAATKKATRGSAAVQEKLRLRAAARPLRTVWAERMSPLLGKNTQDVLAKEEADRFRALEKRVNDLAMGWAEMKKAAEGKIDLSAKDAAKNLRARTASAALAAAEIGVWRPLGAANEHHAIAPDLVEAAAKIDAAVDEKVKATIEQAQAKRRLRFL